MFKVLKKDLLSPGVFRFDVDAPRIAKKTQPGQFIILRVDENGERIGFGKANARYWSKILSALIVRSRTIALIRDVVHYS